MLSRLASRENKKSKLSVKGSNKRTMRLSKRDCLMNYSDNNKKKRSNWLKLRRKSR